MKCKVEKSKISGKISCPANKSYTHRAIFLASLASGKSNVKNILRSADTEATISACKKFGALIDGSGADITVTNQNHTINASTIDAKNSGTTIRIATAVASLSDGTSVLSGDESLSKRPMQPLLDALESMGAKCTSNDGKPPIKVTGKITGGSITIPGNISSQFISALFIAGPLTQQGIDLSIKGELVSKPYLDATIASMKKFGVDVKTKTQYQNYFIPSGKYGPTTFVVPPDYSSLALILSAGVLVGENFSINIVSDDLPQGDKLFLEILKILGVKVSIENNELKISSPAELAGGKFDLSNNPDLLPPLSILILKSKPIKIFNVKHARYKETDRIAIIARELSKIGICVKENEDGLELEKTNSLHGAEMNAEKDHRLFMAFFIAGMLIGNCTVTDPESVDVSYPNFVEEMVRVGAKVQTIP